MALTSLFQAHSTEVNPNPSSATDTKRSCCRGTCTGRCRILKMQKAQQNDVTERMTTTSAKNTFDPRKTKAVQINGQRAVDKVLNMIEEARTNRDELLVSVLESINLDEVRAAGEEYGVQVIQNARLGSLVDVPRYAWPHIELDEDGIPISITEKTWDELRQARDAMLEKRRMTLRRRIAKMLSIRWF